MAKLSSLTIPKMGGNKEKIRLLTEDRFIEFQSTLFGVFKTLQKDENEKNKIRKRMKILQARTIIPEITGPEKVDDTEDGGSSFWDGLKKIFGFVKDAISSIWNALKAFLVRYGAY